MCKVVMLQAHANQPLIPPFSVFLDWPCVLQGQMNKKPPSGIAIAKIGLRIAHKHIKVRGSIFTQSFPAIIYSHVLVIQQRSKGLKRCMVGWFAPKDLLKIGGCLLDSCCYWQAAI
jgi:hypothetical protein